MIWIILLLVVGLAWAIFGFVLQWSLLVPTIITVVVAIIAIALGVMRTIKAKRSAHALEAAIAEQATAQAMNARPEKRAEIQALQKQIQDGIKSLKSSKLGGKKRGAAALYSLPWYAIIGPPGAGKTTALKHSGLVFPYADGGMKGVGGTRNCDWWFTNDAILLDTERGASKPRWLDTYAFKIVTLAEPVAAESLERRLLDRGLLHRHLLSGLHAAVLFRLDRLLAGLLLAPLLVLPLGHMDRVLIVSRYGGDGAVEKPGVGGWVVRVDGLLAAAVHADLRRHLSSAFGIENRERELAMFAGKIKRRPVRDGRVRALVMLAGGGRGQEKGSDGKT